MYEGRTFVITGASKGIGLQYVSQVLESGGKAVAAVRSPEACVALKELQAKHGQALLVVRLDASVFASAYEAAAKVDQVHPEGIDFLVANAASISPRKDINCPDIDLDPEDFDDVLRVNVSGAFATIKAFYPLLKRKVDGRKVIVTMTSLAGTISDTAARARNFQGPPDPADNIICAYKTSKSALNQMTIQLAQSLKSEGFTCIAMHPGLVQTDIASGILSRFKKIMGFDEFPPGMVLTPEHTVRKQLEYLASSTAARDNGRYMDFDGKDLPW